LKKARLPKGKLSVDRLLGFEDIAEAKEFIAENKAEIDGLCVLYYDKDSRIHCQTNLSTQRVIALLELAKALYVEEWLKGEDDD